MSAELVPDVVFLALGWLMAGTMLVAVGSLIVGLRRAKQMPTRLGIWLSAARRAGRRMAVVLLSMVVAGVGMAADVAVIAEPALVVAVLAWCVGALQAARSLWPEEVTA